MQSLVAQLQETLEPVVDDLGYELLCLEYQSGEQNGLLRLYIDSPKGIGLGDCEKVSRDVSAYLDVEDPIPGAYRLEVSSPGADRPLVKPEHFQQYIGEQIKVRLDHSAVDRRNFKGRLLSCGESSLVIEVDGESFELALAQIERARLIPNFGN